MSEIQFLILVNFLRVITSRILISNGKSLKDGYVWQSLLVGFAFSTVVGCILLAFSFAFIMFIIAPIVEGGEYFSFFVGAYFISIFIIMLLIELKNNQILLQTIYPMNVINRTTLISFGLSIIIMVLTVYLSD